MKKYILMRLLLMVPTLWGVTIVVFLMLQMIPGDPIQIWMGMDYDPVAAEIIKKDLGLDRPIYIQYFKWLFNVLRGDLGKSIQTNVPVMTDILQRFPVTLELTVLSMIVVVCLALFLGTTAASRQNTWMDYSSMVVASAGISIPEFYAGLLLIILFGVNLHILPTSGYQPLSAGLGENLRYMVLPAIALGFSRAAATTRMLRSSMIDVLKSEYIETARSKGVSSFWIIFKHALRNAMIPTITVIGVTLGYMLGGAIVVEKVFALPGLGTFVVDAILQGDYPKVQGMVLVSAAVFVILNLIVDLTYSLIDPRKLAMELPRTIKKADALSKHTPDDFQPRRNRSEEILHSRRLARSKNVLFGFCVVAGILLCAGLSEVLAPFSPTEVRPGHSLEPPGRVFLLGTDLLGRDILSRIVYGSRVALRVGVGSMIFAAIAGTLFGSVGGYYGGALDNVLSRIMDIMFAFPILLLAIVIVVATGNSGEYSVVTALCVAYIPSYYRVVRSGVIAIKENDYIDALRCLGFNNFRIIYRHIIPNCIYTVIVVFTLFVGYAVLAEASLSFLGMGTKPPTPSWGMDLQASMTLIEVAPWTAIFPGLAIMVSVLGFNLLGDGLRDVLDPKLKM